MKDSQRLLGSAVLAAFLIPFAAFATTYHLVSEDASTQCGFNTAARWQDEAGNPPAYAPNDANAASFDFIITNGFGMRTTTVPCTWYGKSLTLGDARTGGRILNKSYSITNSYPNGIVLVKGSYRAVSSGATGTDNTAYVAGRLIVRSGVTDPFLFDSSASTGCGFDLPASFEGDERVGEERTAVKFDANNKDAIVFTLSGDNSACKSRMIVTGYKPTFRVASPTALGGALSESDAEALQFSFRDWAKLVFDVADGTVVTAANRGISALFSGSSTARDALYLETDTDVELALPVSGTTPVKKTGAGRLTLSGGYSAGKLTLVEGRLDLRVPAGACPLEQELSAGMTVLSGSATDDLILSAMTFNGGGVRISIDARDSANPTVGKINLADGCAIAAPIPVEVGGGYATNGLRVAIMTVASAVKAVTPSDFVVTDELGLGNPVIEIDGETVYLVMGKVVRSILQTPATGKDWRSPAQWADGAAPHDDADYLVDGRGQGVWLLRSPAGATPMAFLGKSLTLVASDDPDNYNSLSLKGSECSFADLRMGANATISQGDEKSTHIVRGRILVCGGASSAPAVWLTSTATRTMEIAADVQYDAPVQKTGNGILVLSGTASGSVRRLSVNAGKLKISSPEATHNLNLSFAAGTGYEMDYQQPDAARQTGLLCTNALTVAKTLSISLAGTPTGRWGGGLAICTVTPEIAAGLRGKIDISAVPEKYKASLDEEVLPSGLVRFSLVKSEGFVIIFR